MSKRFSLWLDGDRNRELTAQLAERFGVREFRCAPTPRFEIAPSQRIGAVVSSPPDAEHIFESFRWGLVPFWTQELDNSHRLFHARAETLAQKPAFRYALAERRCIIPATGFFEWMETGGLPSLVRYRPRGSEFFGFAALWDEWQGPEGLLLHTCTIITTDANPLVAPLSLRMPAILRAEDEATWLNPAVRDEARLRSLLHPFPEKKMAAFRLASQGDSAVEELDEETLRDSSDAAEKRAASLYPERRLVRRDSVSPDGQIFFKTHSFTRRDNTWWHPVVDVVTGEVFCDCPDFRFRHARHEPHVQTPQFWCKHLSRAVENCRRHGDLTI